MSSQSPEYLFLTGKIRALEKELFDLPRFSRLMEHKDQKDFIDDLADSRYYQFINNKDFERGLSEYIGYNYSYLKKKMQNSAPLDIFMIRYDILNYINLLKGLEDDSYFEAGVFKTQWWKKDKYPVFFIEAEKRIKRMSGTTDAFGVQEGLIEKVCMDLAYDRLKDSIGSKKVLEYWKYSIDILNLLKNANHPISRHYMGGGNIEETFWKNINVKEEMPGKLTAQSYVKEIMDESNSIMWESKLNRWLGKLIKDMRKMTFGPAPVVSYLLSLIEETKNLKYIHTGINLGMSGESIFEKLNLAYV